MNQHIASEIQASEVREGHVAETSRTWKSVARHVFGSASLDFPVMAPGLSVAFESDLAFDRVAVDPAFVGLDERVVVEHARRLERDVVPLDLTVFDRGLGTVAAADRAGRLLTVLPVSLMLSRRTGRCARSSIIQVPVALAFSLALASRVDSPATMPTTTATNQPLRCQVLTGTSLSIGCQDRPRPPPVSPGPKA